MTELYFDNAATTKPYPEVLDVMMDAYKNWWNPNSSYEPARELREKINQARRVIADSINADPEEIYFTSGGSEGNSWVRHNWPEDEVFITEIEHHSLIDGYNNKKVGFLPVDGQGYVDCKKSYLALRPETMVILGLANNEIGTVQNIKQISNMVHDPSFNSQLCVDAVQAYGHIPIDVKEMGVDILTASAHKFHGPVGVGFIYISHETYLGAMIYGTQNNGLRGGTLPGPLILGMAKAVELFDFKRQDQVAEIRGYMIKKLHMNFNCKINGDLVHRLPNNVNVTFLDTNLTSDQLVYMLSDRGIYCSAGSACSEGLQKPSHVLIAIGLSSEMASHTLRFTLPDDVTKADVDRVIKELKIIFNLSRRTNL